MRGETRAYTLTAMRNLRQDIDAKSFFFIEVSCPDEQEEDSLRDDFKREGMLPTCT